MSFFSIISHADFLVKFVLFLLVIVSVWSWGLFFEKLAVFKIKSALSDSFKREFNSGDMLDAIYNRLASKKKIFSPFARIFFYGMKELNMSNIRGMDFSQAYSEGIKRNIVSRINACMEIERLKIVDEMKAGISGLATISSVAPFLGLFGTVWGVMRTFYLVSEAKVLNFAAVIPGIAESLIVTIAGLLVTVPAIIFYNILVGRLNMFISESEIFSLDLSNVLSRELDILTANAYSRKAEEEKTSTSADLIPQ